MGRMPLMFATALPDQAALAQGGFFAFASMACLFTF